MKIFKTLMPVAFISVLALPLGSVRAEDKVDEAHLKASISTLMEIRGDLLKELKESKDLEKMVEIGSQVHELDGAITILHQAELYMAKHKEGMKEEAEKK